MKIVCNGEEKIVTFKTQHGTTGSVNLGVRSDADAAALVKAMKVKELETVSEVVNLTHQVVTQIVAGKKVTVADAITLWEKNNRELAVLSPTTLRNNLSIVQVWVREMKLADLPITAVEPLHVSRYVNSGHERRSTALRKLTAIRQFLTFCHESGYVVRNSAGRSLARVSYDSFTHVEKEKNERSVFTPEEINLLLQNANPFWKAAIILARDTGLRLGDICKLEWSSFKDGRLIVWTEKADKRVDVPVTTDILEVMAALPSTNFQYCFPEQRDKLLCETTRAVLSSQFIRICKKAGVTGKSFHCLRHTNATNLVKQIGLERVAERLGHSSTATTAGYVHVGNS